MKPIRLLILLLGLTSVLSCDQPLQPALEDDVQDQQIFPQTAEQSGLVDTVFGPEVFVRRRHEWNAVTRGFDFYTGDEREFTVELEHYDGPFTVRIENGDENGKRRVTVAWVLINGKPVFKPQDFKWWKRTLSKEVGLTENAKLRVRIAGMPGSQFRLWIEGKFKPGRARIGPEGGLVESADSEILLNVPEGALPTPEIVAILNDTSQVDLPDDLKGMVVKRMRLVPDGVHFEKAVTLTVSIADADDPARAYTLGQYIPSGGWLAPISTVVNVADGTVSTSLSHFSTYWLWDAHEIGSGTWGWVLSEYPASTPDGLTRQAYLDALIGDIDNAFKQWEMYVEAADISFVERKEKPFIDVRFIDPDDDNVYWGFYRREVLGNGEAGVAGWDVHRNQRVILLDDKNFEWLPAILTPAGDLEQISVQAVVLHEIGHHLGLSDVTDKKAPSQVMKYEDSSPSPTYVRCPDLIALEHQYSALSVADKCASMVEVVSGPPSLSRPGIAAPNPSLKVTDRYGNGVENIMVVFFVHEPPNCPKSDPTGCGQLQDRVAITDANGIADVGAWILPTEEGPYTLEAMIGGFVPSFWKFQTEVSLASVFVPIWIETSAGRHHSCGIANDGAAYCWGQNDNGQLGDGSRIPYRVPVRVDDLGGTLRFVDLDAARSHTCGVTVAGDIYCWGANSFGLGDGETVESDIPIQVADPVGGPVTFSAVASGGLHSCALSSGQDVYCWGTRSTSGAGDIPDHPAIPTLVVGGHKFTSISAGNGHSCAIDLQGDGYCWGHGGNGQLGDGNQTPVQMSPVKVLDLTFKSLTAGYNATCGVDASNQAYCWGSNGWGQLGYGASYVGMHGFSRPGVVDTDVQFNLVTIYQMHTCAVATDGSLWCWGRNNVGQLGDNTQIDRPSPVEVVGDHVADQVSVNGYHTCALTSTGSILCWGSNASGQLGNPTVTDLSAVPVSVSDTP